MDNALIDDRRIHVDFSQSVSKLWSNFRRGQSAKGKGCFKCGAPDHIAKDCTGEPSIKQQPSNYVLKNDNGQRGEDGNSRYEMVFDEDAARSPQKEKRDVKTMKEIMLINGRWNAKVKISSKGNTIGLVIGIGTATEVEETGRMRELEPVNPGGTLNIMEREGIEKSTQRNVYIKMMTGEMTGIIEREVLMILIVETGGMREIIEREVKIMKREGIRKSTQRNMYIKMMTGEMTGIIEREVLMVLIVETGGMREIIEKRSEENDGRRDGRDGDDQKKSDVDGNRLDKRDDSSHRRMSADVDGRKGRREDQDYGKRSREMDNDRNRDRDRRHRGEGREGIGRQEEGEWNGVAGKGERDEVGSNSGEGVGCSAGGVSSDKLTGMNKGMKYGLKDGQRGDFLGTVVPQLMDERVWVLLWFVAVMDEVVTVVLRSEPNVGTVGVPDSRLNVLSDLSKSQRAVPASIEFVDIAGLVKGASQGELIQSPDIDVINLELVFSDLDQEETEKSALERIQRALMDGKPARSVPLTDFERESVKHLCLLTMKPIIYVANVAESDLAAPEDNPHVKEVMNLASELQSGLVAVSAQVESELTELPSEERSEFLKSLGVDDSGLGNLIRATYSLLGLRTYFTSGEKDCFVIGNKSVDYTCRNDGPQAAGVIIHSDFEKGFIRAETVAYDDFVASGSFSAAREKGLLRSEGKEYIVKEGDVMLFRFNV
ncbi:GTP-binding protein-like protein [Actinidia rufa]|uniref:GTP-binding protein-like protein n=1 Tax=Actinidia rufa TaxID=165716 RepID=A0A7J0DYM4_9ERIC|nr:GTP-binding protein-like protein [Actinidia rufa]